MYDLPSLERLTRQLSGPGAVNYHVSAQLFIVRGAGESSFNDIAREALGDKAEIDDVRSCDAADVLMTVQQTLGTCGDYGSHPSFTYIDSMDFIRDLQHVIDEVTTLVEGADVLAEVRLKGGHPFYPVFWDFAYIITHGTDAYLLIASSSD